MYKQLSTDARRVASIVDTIEDYNRTISELEYEICDTSHDESEIEDMEDEQKRLQNRVNTMTNGLKFDENVEIEYDGKITQVRRNGVRWLENYGEGWIERDPIEGMQAEIEPDENCASDIIADLNEE